MPLADEAIIMNHLYYSDSTIKKPTQIKTNVGHLNFKHMSYSCIGKSELFNCESGNRIILELLDFIEPNSGQQRNLIYFSHEPKLENSEAHS